MDAHETGAPANGPPYQAKAIANYFLKLAKEEREPLTQMKLQKLIYFAHGWYLALYGKPLLNERVQAWEFGPVVRTVYEAFKGFGKDPITAPAESLQYLGDQEVRSYVPMIAPKDVLTAALLNRIWSVYKPISAYQLSSLTHQPGTPWDQTYTSNPGVRNLTIDDDAIKRAFEMTADANRKRPAAATIS